MSNAINASAEEPVKESPEKKGPSKEYYYAWGLNKTGFTFFMLLLLFGTPFFWVPWFIKSWRAKKCDRAPKGMKQEESSGEKMLKKYFYLMIVVLGVPTFLQVSGIFNVNKSMAESDLKAAIQDQEIEIEGHFSEGYQAGYDLLKDSGKILSEQAPPAERAAQIKTVESGADKTAQGLAFDYGKRGNQSWIDGCKKGLIDAIRGTRARY